MILSDVNVWLALTLSGHAHHPAAKSWFDSISTRGTVVFCRETQRSLLRLLTTTAVFANFDIGPVTNQEAWDIYSALVADERVVFQDEPPHLEGHWAAYALRETPSPKLWMDAYLAAFARAASCRIVTTDTAFTQFPDLEVVLLGTDQPEAE